MNRIAEARKKANMSQAELGRKIGAAQNTISNWENGNRQPNNDDLLRLAKALRTTVDYLLGVEKEKAPADEAELKYIDFPLFFVCVSVFG